MDTAPEALQDLQGSLICYSLFARALDYPDQELVEILVSGKFLGGLQQTGVVSATGNQISPISAREIADFVKGKGAEQLLLELQKDYTRMCFASKPRLVPLFESVYLEGKLYQDSTLQIARLYDEAGLRLTEKFKLPPDHISLELEFMSYLLYQEIDARKNEDTELIEEAVQFRQEVLHKHLGKFASKLLTKMEQGARTPFYRNVAPLAREFLQRELDR